MGMFLRAVVLAVPIAGLCALTTSAPGFAMDGGWASDGPNCAVTSDMSERPSVWLGHFSGGSSLADGRGLAQLDWRDDYVCFASRKACRSWRAQMRKSYARVEGWGTCLPIR